LITRYLGWPLGRGPAISVSLALAFLVCPLVPRFSLPAIAEPAPESTDLVLSVDIRPGLCPNHLRIESPLTIPIAITGRADFEVAQVDPASIHLCREGFARQLEPISWAYADVGTPIVGGLCACHKLRGDGIDDLEFQFSIQDIAAAFDLAARAGDLVELTLRGNLTTGEEVEGSDCAMVITGLWEDDDLGKEVYLLAMPQGEAPPGEFKFAYQTTVSDRVTFTIHDVRGQVVAVLNDMDMAPGIYTATWNGLGPTKEEAPAGIYFARVSNSLASDIMKVTLSR
jgi:hypothetical protein